MAKKPGTIWMMVLVGWLCLAGMPTGAARAQGVPAAIKYQAVLRDVEGEPLSDRGGLAVRITLRQGSPAGSILYQETHDRLTTDAFGLLQLEIGRGTVSPAGLATLSDIPWENSPIYAEIEVQSDDNGYTTMGASELLSVPYALYAGNASVGFGLTDGVLPKYDAGYLNLVDSKLSETLGGELQFYNGENAYRFPVRRGTKNQSLTLIDDEGTLGWRTGGGGGGAECDGCRDGYMTYWDDVAGLLHTTDMQYDEQTGTVYAGNQFVSPNVLIVENEMEINGTVSGNHNLQYNNPGTNSVWVGNSRNGSDAYRLAGDGVTIDSLNKTLRFGGGASVWGFQPEGTVDHIYTKLNTGQSVHVGIGVERPKTRLHMQDGALLLSGTPGGDDGAPGEWTAGNHLYWHAGKGALRMGKFDQDQSGLWSTVSLGDNSIALGTNAEAMQADNVAIGADAKAQGTHTMVFGQNAVAQGDRGLAMGYNVKVSGERAVGIGSGYSENINSPTFNVEGARSVGIGYDVRNPADDAVAVGQGIAMEKRAGNSVVLGSELTVADELGVTIGYKIKEENASHYGGNIQLGSKLNLIESGAVINIGANNDVDHCQAGAVCIGGDLVTNNLGPTINIGFNNQLPLTSSSLMAGPTVIGCNLTYNEEDGVVLGKYNNETLEFLDVPALVVGVGTNRGRKNALELSEEGALYLLGDKAHVYANGLQLTSDVSLKTDIQPLGLTLRSCRPCSPCVTASRPTRTACCSSALSRRTWSGIFRIWSRRTARGSRV